MIPGLRQPESNKTQPEGQRRADIETPGRLEPKFDNPWATLPFAEATWRSIYRVRAVTSDPYDPYDPYDPRSLKPATTMPWPLIREW